MIKLIKHDLAEIFSVAVGMFAIVLGGSNFEASAGPGTFNPSTGEFNFCISARFNASAAQIQQIQEGFQGASQILADATDGQHRFGTIRIVNNSGASGNAEFYVHGTAGRANAVINGYGNRGQYSNVYLQGQNGADSINSTGSIYTIAHEFGHLGYGIYDSYNGDGNAPASEESPTLNYSLMDNYFSRGGNHPVTGNGTFTLNEFSVAANHDPNMDTFQSTSNMESDWETLSSSRFPAVAPTGFPVSAPPAPHNVSFVDGTGDLRAMLVVDRSGSMAIENRIGFAMQGVGVFANTIRLDRILNGESQIGLASFAGTATLDTALGIANSSQVSSVTAAGNNLSASGSTNIGGGLTVGLNELTSETQRSCNEVLILFSDGDHNTGPTPESVLPAITNEGVTVVSVAIGTGLSSSGLSSLQNLANQTGGRFAQVTNSFQLISLFAQLAFESLGNGVLSQAPSISFTEGEAETFTFQVENGVNEVTAVFSRAEENDDFTVRLFSPSGEEATTNNGLERETTTNSETLILSAPESGFWELEVTATNVTSGIGEVIISAQGGGGALFVSVPEEMRTFPEPVIVRATPQFQDFGVIGASVSAQALRPDGSLVDFELNDDGLNGDVLANDGEYAAEFTQFEGDGAYTFIVQAQVTQEASVLQGEVIFDQAPELDLQIESFTRFASGTSVITNTPTIGIGDVDQDGDVDSDDVRLLLQDRGNSVSSSACGQTCDLNNDGMIDVLDARLVAARCTRESCATN